MNIKKHILTTLILIALTFSQTILFANNIQVSNISLTGQDTASKFTMVKFDISWENSWRTSTHESNWDAAWIFVKFRLKSETVWYHAYLNDSNHVAPSGSVITPGLVVTNADFDSANNPAVGVFLYRGANGTGDVSYENVQLRWNYGVNGLADHDRVEVAVFAIEMVYIPEGSFYVGDGVPPLGAGAGTPQSSNSPGHFVAGSTTKPFKITSEAEIIIGNTDTTQLWGTTPTAWGSGIGTAGILPAEFPKGFQSFYIMKYELSQYMYKEFLNKLTRKQQPHRVSTTVVGTFMSDNDTSTTPKHRNGIKVKENQGNDLPLIYGNDLNNNNQYKELDDGEHIACNWVNIYDLMAFADWSGLRPFTELEYEKACRGALEPVANEYAWGSNDIFYATDIANPGMENECATNTDANIVINYKTNGPMRCGCFAKSATNRVQAGATYYGVMEMSGNLVERVYSVGTETNRSFNGNIHGDGKITDENGEANENNWPSGIGMRGTAWNVATSYFKHAQISSRIYATYNTTFRASTYGIRLARTQPKID